MVGRSGAKEECHPQGLGALKPGCGARGRQKAPTLLCSVAGLVKGVVLRG